MSRDKEFLLDILEAARLAIKYTSGKSKNDFLKDIQCQDAVVRRLEVIGEAAKRVSDESRKKIPSLPWKAMTSMRNIMIHEYDDVDFNIVWDTVRNDLPNLVTELEKFLQP